MSRAYSECAHRLAGVLVDELAVRVVDENRGICLALEGAICDGPAEPIAPPVRVGVAKPGVAEDEPKFCSFSFVTQSEWGRSILYVFSLLVPPAPPPVCAAPAPPAPCRLPDVAVGVYSMPSELARALVPDRLNAFGRSGTKVFQAIGWMPPSDQIGLARGLALSRPCQPLSMIGARSERGTRSAWRWPGSRSPGVEELHHVGGVDPTPVLVEVSCDLRVGAVVAHRVDVPAGADVGHLDEAQAEAEHRVAAHLLELRDRDALALEGIAELIGDITPVLKTLWTRDDGASSLPPICARMTAASCVVICLGRSARAPLGLVDRRAPWCPGRHLPLVVSGDRLPEALTPAVELVWPPKAYRRRCLHLCADR
jgi:hypothetical protein